MELKLRDEREGLASYSDGSPPTYWVGWTVPPAVSRTKSRRRWYEAVSRLVRDISKTRLIAFLSSYIPQTRT